MARPAPLPALRDLLARVHLRLIVFAVALAGASLLFSGMMVINAYTQRNLALIARTVSYTVEPAIVLGDRRAVREEMVSVAAIKGIQRLEVRDPAGRVLAEWTAPEHGMDAVIERVAGWLTGPKPAIDQVRSGAKAIAEVRVYGSATVLARYLLSGALISLCCLGLTIIATRMLADKLDEDVIAPLGKVAAVAHAVRNERAFDRRIPSSGIAEVDRFSHDFNALIAELQGWHNSLTEEKADLERQALHDPLTGLGNRVRFGRRLEETVADALRTRRSFAVLYLDADHFKGVNDRHGHSAGDAMLRAVAERIDASIRTADDAFRIGGDEFAVILAAPADREQVAAVLERIEAAMHGTVLLPQGEAVAISISAGSAIYPDDGLAPHELLNRADQGMYRHKNRRRGETTAKASNA